MLKKSWTEKLLLGTALLLLVFAACYAEPPAVYDLHYPDLDSFQEPQNDPPGDPDALIYAEHDETPYDWLESMITDEHPREFWENQMRSAPTADAINEMFYGGGWTPDYPPYFGGLYLNDEGRLTVLIVEALAETEEALAFLAQVEELGGALIRQVEFSIRELTEVQDYLGEIWNDNPAMENVRGSGLDTKNNRIEVHLLYGDDESIAHFRSEVLDTPMITFVATRGAEQQFETPAPPLRVHEPLIGAGLRVTDTSGLPSTITVEVYNNSAYTVLTGYPFSVEAFDGESWWVVPMHGAFILPAFSVEPGGEPFSFDKNLTHNVGSLEPGLYRIRKDVFREECIPIHDGVLHDVTSEFTISDTPTEQGEALALESAISLADDVIYTSAD